MTIDKTQWPDGPWQTEPDRVEFRAHGLPCLMTRQPNLGHWCGYVAVPPGHPWHGKGYDDLDIQAHGGLTYANGCRDDVCHVPAPGEPDDVWWLGFDCAHGGDTVPGMLAHDKLLGDITGKYRKRWEGDSYKDVAYVRAECEQLAEQAVKAAK